MSNHTDISGCRVLIAEDEPFIALMLEDYLAECGCIITGSTNSLAKCINFASNDELDFAILDVKLGSCEVFPAADILEKRGVPFLILSGFGCDVVPKQKPNWIAVAKPFTFEALASAIDNLLQRATVLEPLH